MFARMAVLLSLVSLAAVAGCQATTPAGPVTATAAQPGWEKGPVVGLAAPRIDFTAQDGKPRSVRGNTGWITLIAFVQTEGKECDYLLPVLVDAAGRYFNQPVRVVQIAEPIGSCPHCEACVEAGHAHLLHLMALCDPQHQAYGAFGRPVPGTLLLVGSNGKVLEVGKVDEVAKLYPKLDGLTASVERQSLPLYLQTYTE